MSDNSEVEVLERVKRVVAKHHNFDGKDFTLSTTLEELGLDSFDAVNITFALEEEFGVEIPGEGLRDVKSVGEVLGLLRTALNSAATSNVARPNAAGT